jgi:hypothetical protein
MAETEIKLQAIADSVFNTTTGKQPMARLRKSGNSAMAHGTFTVVPWETEDVDLGGFHSTSVNTGRFTIPTGYGGYYLVGTQVQVEKAVCNWELGIYKNGAAVSAGNALGALAAVFIGLSCVTLVSLAATDYVDVRCYQDSGTDKNVLQAGDMPSVFWIVRLF